MPTIVLDDAHANRLLVFGEPTSIIEARSLADLPAAFAVMEAARAAGAHLAGYCAYELGYLLEPRLNPRAPAPSALPLLWFGVFPQAPLHVEGDAASAWWKHPERAYAGPLTTAWTCNEYGHRFGQTQALIRAGDVFQINLTFPATFPFAGAPKTLYAALRVLAGAPHGAYIDDGVRHILSCSPELFFAIDASGAIRTEPMKGTASRGATPQEDASLLANLSASPKDRAENLMIVDLIRNDLGRIAPLGHVSVDALFAIKTFPTVHQMVSRVSASLKPDVDIETTLRALFPCGSVTGAPKIRAMELISELEPASRGLYCGAIGHFAPDGAASFNVAIRTITIEGARGTLGIGGAITIDSNARGEWEECLLKSCFYERARRPLFLIETLFYRHGHFSRRSLHLERIQNSAATFAIPFDWAAAERTLGAAVADSSSTYRVRLTLAENGHFEATATPFDPRPPDTWRFTISPMLLASGDVLLRHKTSDRDLYDGEHARIAAATGCDEVVFLNERGEICEGSRTNIFVRFGDRLLTPVHTSGLLQGCLRRELLASGQCEEAVLRPPDLERADELLLGNSLRGLIPSTWQI